MPPSEWIDVYEADSPGNVCPQSPWIIELSHPGWDKYSEDCLHVDIVTPVSIQRPNIKSNVAGLFQHFVNISFIRRSGFKSD